MYHDDHGSICGGSTAPGFQSEALNQWVPPIGQLLPETMLCVWDQILRSAALAKDNTAPLEQCAVSTQYCKSLLWQMNGVKRVLAATVCHQKKEYRQVAAGQGYACKKQWCVQSAKLDSSYNILHQVHVMSFLTKVMQWWRIGASSADNQYIDCQQSIYQTKSKGENRITTHASLDWTNVTNNPQNAV